jgi:ATPase subunit of ABC transporter with duplicated ATPase domains
MVIISHDRHFLSSVCTHMADVDYGVIKVYPGNYDDYMEASALAKQQLEKDNAKAKDRIADLEDFVRRFRAHKAKARQATSRQKQIEKLKVEDVKPSSRQYPFIRFLVDPKEKLHRLAVEAKGLYYGKLDLTIEAGEKVAIIGPNGVGKTTLLRCLAGALKPDGKGSVKWAEKARTGYWPQDPADEFRNEETLADWMGRWRRKDKAQDEQIVRATLGQLLFSGDDQKKSLRVISGGEGQRMLVGKLILDMPNVILLDEPTNHLDMESIESLNGALDRYPGTLIFVSHDREFVSSLATRIVELKPGGEAIDFRGNYEDYLAGTSTALAA